MKKIVVVIIACLFFLSGIIAAYAVKEYIVRETNLTIEVNGETQNFRLPIVSIDGSTYVALRELCDKIGYKVDWVEKERRIKLSNNEEKKLPFHEDMGKSQQGTLANGKKFNYFPKKEFSVSSQISEWKLSPVNADFGEVATARMAAELGQVVLGYNYENSSVELQVYFDERQDAWLVTGISDGVTHSGARTVVIRRADGKILNKYEIK